MLIDHKIAVHWLLAGFAVSVFCLAALQALLISIQEKQLRSKHAAGMMKIFPPLETMEVFLFRLITCGFFLLTLMLVITVYSFSKNILTLYVLIKILMGGLAWVFFALLLIGRYGFGLRGKQAVYGTLMGALLLIIIYSMSRLGVRLFF